MSTSYPRGAMASESLVGYLRNKSRCLGPTAGDSMNQDLRGSSLKMCNKTQFPLWLTWSPEKCKWKPQWDTTTHSLEWLKLTTDNTKCWWERGITESLISCWQKSNWYSNFGKLKPLNLLKQSVCMCVCVCVSYNVAVLLTSVYSN